MLKAIKSFLYRGKLRKATFHVLTWDLQGMLPDWKLLDEEASDCQYGYPPDLICLQNLPVSAEDPEGAGFIRSLPSTLRAEYFLQGPVIENGQGFVTLLRKETIHFDPMFAEPPAAMPIHADGNLIGIKSTLRMDRFPRTSLSICNCNVPARTPPDHIFSIQNEDICLIAGMFVLIGQDIAWPALGVLDIRDFRQTAAACPASCAPGLPSASRIFYYSAGSAKKDSNCELQGWSWLEPMESGGVSRLTELGKATFGATILHMPPAGWDSER